LAVLDEEHYFHSEDPIEVARIVVSDEVTLLWSRVQDRLGFGVLARSAAPQPAIGGPDLTYFRARLAHRRGEQAAARRLVSDALERLAGHQGYLGFANEIGAPVPAHAEAADHSRFRRLMSDEG